MNDRDDALKLVEMDVVENDQLDDWQRIIELQQLLTSTQVVQIHYTEFTKNHGLLTLHLDRANLDVPIQRISDAQGSELQIQVLAGPPKEFPLDGSEDEDVIREEKTFLTAGILKDCSETPISLGILLDDDIVRLIENEQLSIPDSGWVKIKLVDAKPEKPYLQHAIEQIRHGETKNPRLVEILNNPTATDFHNIDHLCTLTTDDLVFSQNERVKSITQEAINAKDLFILAKSDAEDIHPFVTEFCHQIGLSGKRTLIVTPSDLQINAILANLVKIPTLRPIKLASNGHRDDSATSPNFKYSLVVPSLVDYNASNPNMNDAWQSYYSDLELAINLAPKIENTATSLIELENRSTQLNQELEEKSIQFDQTYRTFLEITHSLEDCEDTHLFLEKVLRRMTQPVFGTDHEDLSKQEEELNTEFVLTNAAFLDLNRYSELLSDELSEWIDETVLRFNHPSKHPILGSFRKADQIHRRYKRVRTQVDETLAWLQARESAIQISLTKKKNLVYLSQLKSLNEKVILRCQNVIESNQYEIPKLQEQIQNINDLYSSIDESRSTLQNWLGDLSKKDLDPAFVNLPEPLNEPRFDSIWSRVWDRFHPQNASQLPEQIETLNSTLSLCENLINEIDSLVEQLSKYTTPEILAGISPVNMNWEVAWIKDLVDFDVENGCAKPRDHAGKRLQEMGTSLIANLDDHEWLEKKFQNDPQLIQFQIAHRIGQLYSIANAVKNYQANLHEEKISLENDPSKMETQPDGDIVNLALKICEELRWQESEDLNARQRRISRATSHKDYLEKRNSQIDRQLGEEFSNGSDQSQYNETNFDDLKPLFPTLPLLSLLDQLESMNHEKWNESWRQEMFIFEGKLHQLDQIAAQLEPTEQLKQIMSDLSDKIQEFEDQHNELEVSIQALGKEVDQVNKAYETTAKELMAVKQDWRSVYQEIPRKLIPNLELDDSASESIITEIAERIDLWKLNLARLADFLNPSVIMSNDWRDYLNIDPETKDDEIKETQIKYANVIATSTELAGSLLSVGSLPEFEASLIVDAHLNSMPDMIPILAQAKKIILIGNPEAKPPLTFIKSAQEIAGEYGLEEPDIQLLDHSLFKQLYESCPSEFRGEI